MDPSTMFDWLDDLWIDSCWLLLLLLQHVCEAHLQHAATANNICPVDLKKTFTFTLAARLHLQQWCQPHFPFRGALKSALCSQPWAPTREMVNELQTQIWQLCLICADLHYFFFFLSNHLSSQATGGCHGDHRPAQRVIKGLDLLWLQSLDTRLKKSRTSARLQTRTEIRRRCNTDPHDVVGGERPSNIRLYSKVYNLLVIFKRSFPFFMLSLLCSSSLGWKTNRRDATRLSVGVAVGSHCTHHTPSLTPLPIRTYRSAQH